MHRYRLCDIRECADPACNHMRMQCMPCYGRARARKRQSGAAATTGAANTSGSFGAHSQKKKVLFMVPYTENVLSIVPFIVHTLCGGNLGTNWTVIHSLFHVTTKKKYSLFRKRTLYTVLSSVHTRW